MVAGAPLTDGERDPAPTDGGAVVDIAAHRGDSYAITPEGFARLDAELRLLTMHRRAEVSVWLREARADGDESADLAQALTEHDRLEARIAELESVLTASRVVDPPSDGTAGIGTRVLVRSDGSRTVEFELVGEPEADARLGRLSVASPVGSALLGRVPGDRIEVQTPGGLRRFELLSVSVPGALQEAA